MSIDRSEVRPDWSERIKELTLCVPFEQVSRDALGAVNTIARPGAVFGEEAPNAHRAAPHLELERHGLIYTEASPEQQRNLDAALGSMTLEFQSEKGCASIEEARALLWRSISIAGGGTRACTEYKGLFWFSRLDWARQDDRSFKSGWAVKKGTGEIYRWEEEKSRPGG